MIMREQERLFPQLDEDLRRRIVVFLFQRNEPALRRIEVDVSNGRVDIRGEVESFYLKQLCLSCCQRVAGVLQVVDEVEVVAAPGR